MPFQSHEISLKVTLTWNFMLVSLTLGTLTTLGAITTKWRAVPKRPEKRVLPCKKASHTCLTLEVIFYWICLTSLSECWQFWTDVAGNFWQRQQLFLSVLPLVPQNVISSGRAMLFYSGLRRRSKKEENGAVKKKRERAGSPSRWKKMWSGGSYI